MRRHRAFSPLLVALMLLIAAVVASPVAARPHDRSATSATGVLAGQGTPTSATLPIGVDQTTVAKLVLSRRSALSAVARTVTRAGGKPQIAKLSPSEGKPNAKVTIKGRSFGAKRGQSTVRFGPPLASRWANPSD